MTTLTGQPRSSVEKSVRLSCAKLNNWNGDRALGSAIEQSGLTRACCCKSVNRFGNEKSKFMQRTVLMLACKPSLQISSALNWTMAYKSTVPYLPWFLQSTIPFLPKHRLIFRNLVFELRLTRLVAGPGPATHMIWESWLPSSVDERNSVLELSLEASSAPLWFPMILLSTAAGLATSSKGGYIPRSKPRITLEFDDKPTWFDRRYLMPVLKAPSDLWLQDLLLGLSASTLIGILALEVAWFHIERYVFK